MFINNILGDRRITFSLLALVIFGSLMIFSAEMGVAAGDTQYLSGVIFRQSIYVAVGIIAYLFISCFRVLRLRMSFYIAGYVIIFVALLSCRIFGMINGAYAWIVIGSSATIQPSEFAKVFMIAFGARLLGMAKPENYMRNLYIYIGCSLAYFLIIFLYQHDLGSSIVLLVICYCVMLIPPYKEYQKVQFYLIIGILLAIALFALLMSPFMTDLMKKHADNYMIGRFLAAADPFLYQFDNGYHIIMSLVSFANGGIFGLGYGESIHKYMNFPNPSNDFILPVIVEELGIVGFSIFIIVYGIMLYPIISASLRTEKTFSKIVLLGTFLYFITHFILNVGGVSGLIPLTGVPLLLISSGGSSLVASMSALGLSQNEIKMMERSRNADRRRQV